MKNIYMMAIILLMVVATIPSLFITSGRSGFYASSWSGYDYQPVSYHNQFITHYRTMPTGSYRSIGWYRSWHTANAGYFRTW